jgi:hypothetical protein
VTRPARTIWERHRGPIPSGHVVHHRDGDAANNDITNLACTTSNRHTGYHASKRPRARKKYADLGPRFGNREVAVIRLLRARPASTAHAIAKSLGLGVYEVGGILCALRRKGAVSRRVWSGCGKVRWSVADRA